MTVTTDDERSRTTAKLLHEINAAYQMTDLALTYRNAQINFVPGEGSLAPLVVFVGEAPGAAENQMRRPFVGRAGKYLRNLIMAVGLDVELECYITNLLKYRPPRNRDPVPAEITSSSPFVRREVMLLRPKVLVALGRHALRVFDPTANITKDHGVERVVRLNGHKAGVMLVPMFHPAYALRQGTNYPIQMQVRLAMERVAKLAREEE